MSLRHSHPIYRVDSAGKSKNPLKMVKKALTNEIADVCAWNKRPIGSDASHGQVMPTIVAITSPCRLHHIALEPIQAQPILLNRRTEENYLHTYLKPKCRTLIADWRRRTRL